MNLFSHAASGGLVSVSVYHELNGTRLMASQFTRLRAVSLSAQGKSSAKNA